MSDFAVGLTGGISTGKSAVESSFARHGVSVIDADRIARDIVEPGQPALALIANRFGPEYLHPDGTLNRPALRRRVFDDVLARRDLEAIMHPTIRLELRRECGLAKGTYVIASIPLLAESGAKESYDWLQRVVVVDAPEAVQLRRLMDRDGINETLAKQMIAAQTGRAERLLIASDVIVNDGSLADLDVAIARLHSLLSSTARRRELRSGTAAVNR